MNENYKEVDVASRETDPNSVLKFYCTAIKLRKELSCVRYGTYKEYNKHLSKVYVYIGEGDKDENCHKKDVL